MLYLDTSVLVASLVNEAATERVQDWLGRQDPAALAASDWVVAEFSSALSIKLRAGQIRAGDRAGALAAFNRIVSESLVLLPITSLHFRAAARFADRQALALRAGDALHLAAAADHGATLCTLDHRLAAAGADLALAVMTL